MSKRDALFPADRHALHDLHRYSAAIRSGDLVFVWDQAGGGEGSLPERVFEDEVRRALPSLRAVLIAAARERIC